MPRVDESIIKVYSTEQGKHLEILLILGDAGEKGQKFV